MLNQDEQRLWKFYFILDFGIKTEQAFQSTELNMESKSRNSCIVKEVKIRFWIDFSRKVENKLKWKR